MTRHPTYLEDAVLEDRFGKYTKRHYNSWVRFADREGYGNDVEPVLVTGFDATKDFAMLAYSNEGAFLAAGSNAVVPMLASANASVWVMRHTSCSPYFKSGPQSWDRLPAVPAINSSSSQLEDARAIPAEFNQCVFVRYYTMRKKWLVPRVIRAGAGPHDLESGDDGGGAFPELTVQSNSEPTMSGDGDLGEQSDLTTEDPDSDLVVVRNTPYVWSLPGPFIFHPNS